MNYNYFSQLENGTLCPAENESEQAFMERVLTAVFTEKTPEMDGKINDLLAPRFCACSAEGKSMTIAFTAQDWMLNPNGTLHGGMLSTAIDVAMSVLSRYLAKKRGTVTVQLSVNFLRVIRQNETFTVCVTADHVGRRSVVTHAVVTAESAPKPAATASAVLM